MTKFVESEVEEVALSWFEELGYEVAFGPDLGPGGSFQERDKWSDVVLVGRLRSAVARLNPSISADAQEEAVRRVLHRESPSLVLENQRLHDLLVEGLPVESRAADGSLAHHVVKFVNFEDVGANEFLAVNQFTVEEGDHVRRPDVVVFVNGLPLAVLELKNPASENATVRDAFRQLQTYKLQIPSLFVFNEVLVGSDGLEARVGSLTADWERFVQWKTVDGKNLAPSNIPQLDVLLRGVFEPGRFLRLIRHFVVFEATGGEPLKKLAAYHQFHAVEQAVEETLRASAPGGDRRVGVVWHTQGSGKSLTMVFYAGRIVVEPAMNNLTLVVVTDRNDLDGQLYGVFGACTDLLRQTPEQAEDRDELQRRLRSRASGGIIFTTIQKFAPDEGASYPMLSDRTNIVVVADEAHRSQYGFDPRYEQKTGEVSYGFAKHLRDGLPNASSSASRGRPLN